MVRLSVRSLCSTEGAVAFCFLRSFTRVVVHAPLKTLLPDSEYCPVHCKLVCPYPTPQYCTVPRLRQDLCAAPSSRHAFLFMPSERLHSAVRIIKIRSIKQTKSLKYFAMQTSVAIPATVAALNDLTDRPAVETSKLEKPTHPPITSIEDRETSDTIVVDFEDNDPENPYNWSRGRKWSIVSAVSLMSLVR